MKTRQTTFSLFLVAADKTGSYLAAMQLQLRKFCCREYNELSPTTGKHAPDAR